MFSSPTLRKRILKSRAASRDKNKGIPPIKAKCRVVAIGCGDPDLHEISRECITPLRQSEYLIYCLYISGKNHKLLGGDLWVLWCGDIKTAFLQGQPEQRSLPLFLLPPRDGVTIQTFQSRLYQIIGNLYGLGDVPRTGVCMW